MLARRHRAPLNAPSRSVLGARLFESFDVTASAEVAYLVADGDDVFVGCTPERLVSRQRRAVSVDVLAGTARLGDDEIKSADKERR